MKENIWAKAFQHAVPLSKAKYLFWSKYFPGAAQLWAAAGPQLGDGVCWRDAGGGGGAALLGGDGGGGPRGEAGARQALGRGRGLRGRDGGGQHDQLQPDGQRLTGGDPRYWHTRIHMTRYHVTCYSAWLIVELTTIVLTLNLTNKVWFVRTSWYLTCPHCFQDNNPSNRKSCCNLHIWVVQASLPLSLIHFILSTHLLRLLLPLCRDPLYSVHRLAKSRIGYFSFKINFIMSH